MANILIVGNGFDLVHNLPTKYSDYLSQLNKGSKFYEYIKLKNSRLIINLDKLIGGKVCNYLTMKMNENKGWIDFENELKEIVDEVSNIKKYFVKKLDLVTKKQYFLVEETNLENIPIFILKYIFRNGNKKLDWKPKEIEEIIKEIREHISLFIHFFEEYLIWIFDTKEDDIQELLFFRDLNIDYLLSFNYTSTYEILYNDHRRKKFLFDTDICYVHGTINSNYKIVMGIGSEYYDENIHEDYVEFFKFFQRYKYETDCKYQEWIQNIKKDKYSFDVENKSDCHTVTIYGHSLDPTDKDILYPFLSMRNTQIKIYYYGEKNKLKIEKNLLKILGRNLFEEYLTGGEKKILLINSEDIE